MPRTIVKVPIVKVLTLKILAWAVLALSIAAGAAQAQKLKIAEVVRSQLFTPVYLAIGEGFAKREGLDVEFVTANGGDRVGALVLSGQANIGLAGPEVAIYIYNSESPDKPVMFCSINATDGFFLLSREKIASFTWDKLQGRKIVGWRPGSTPELFFEYVLKERGVDPPTIKSIITNISPPAREGAWLSGNGDFGIFNEPSTTNLVSAGHAHVLASIGKELGLAENTVLFAKKSWYENNRDVAQKLTNAVARAQLWMRTHSDEQIAEAVAPYFPGIAKETTVSVMRRYREAGAPIFSHSTVIDPEGLAKLQEIMVLGGVLPAEKKVAYDAIVAPEIATEAQRLLQHKQ